MTPPGYSSASSLHLSPAYVVTGALDEGGSCPQKLEGIVLRVTKLHQHLLVSRLGPSNHLGEEHASFLSPLLLLCMEGVGKWLLTTVRLDRPVVAGLQFRLVLHNRWFSQKNRKSFPKWPSMQSLDALPILVFPFLRSPGR